jgi:hypothetical protein
VIENRLRRHLRPCSTSKTWKIRPKTIQLKFLTSKSRSVTYRDRFGKPKLTPKPTEAVSEFGNTQKHFFRGDALRASLLFWPDGRSDLAEITSLELLWCGVGFVRPATFRCLRDGR